MATLRTQSTSSSSESATGGPARLRAVDVGQPHPVAAVDVDLRQVRVLQQGLQPAEPEQGRERRGDDRVVLAVRGQRHPGVDLVPAPLRQGPDQQGTAHPPFVVPGQLRQPRVEAAAAFRRPAARPPPPAAAPPTPGPPAGSPSAPDAVEPASRRVSRGRFRCRLLRGRVGHAGPPAAIKVLDPGHEAPREPCRPGASSAERSRPIARAGRSAWPPRAAAVRGSWARTPSDGHVLQAGAVGEDVGDLSRWCARRPPGGGGVGDDEHSRACSQAGDGRPRRRGASLSRRAATPRPWRACATPDTVVRVTSDDQVRALQHRGSGRGPRQQPPAVGEHVDPVDPSPSRR